MRSTKPTTRRRLRLWQVLLALFQLAAACGGDEPLTEPTASTQAAVAMTITAAPVTTTTSEVSTAAVEALLAEYYAAYNSGDAAAAIGMLSELMRETPAPNLEFWIGTLHEQVSAECVPATASPGGVRCVETYADALHGPAGATGRAIYQYFERDGKLLQIDDDSFWPLPGCNAGRCPGEILEVAGADPTWSYDQIEPTCLIG